MVLSQSWVRWPSGMGCIFQFQIGLCKSVSSGRLRHEVLVVRDANISCCLRVLCNVFFLHVKPSSLACESDV